MDVTVWTGLSIKPAFLGASLEEKGGHKADNTNT